MYGTRVYGDSREISSSMRVLRYTHTICQSFKGLLFIHVHYILYIHIPNRIHNNNKCIRVCICVYIYIGRDPIVLDG